MCTKHYYCLPCRFHFHPVQVNRLKTAEKEKDSLEGDRQKADEFLRLDAAIRKKQNVLYQTHIAHATTNVEKASNLEYNGARMHMVVRTDTYFLF